MKLNESWKEMLSRAILFLILSLEKIREKIRVKCKFHKICALYQQNSHTCNHGGGDYCGRYRFLKDEVPMLDKRDKKFLTLYVKAFRKGEVKIVK